MTDNNGADEVYGPQSAADWDGLVVSEAASPTFSVRTQSHPQDAS